MTGLFHNVGFLLYCFTTAAVSLKVLPPENVRLGWKDGLYQELFWTHSKNYENHCFYQINSTRKKEGQMLPAFYKETSLSWLEYREINGGFLNISIQTVCNGTKSDPVFVTLNDPDLNLSCLIMSLTLTRCSWKPHFSADIRFFYNLDDTDENVSVPLRECPLYTDNMTGCDLQVKPHQQLNVLLNGTVSNRTIRNIYQLSFLKMKLSRLKWTVNVSKEQFHISWTPPDFPYLVWKYYIKYSACKNIEDVEIVTGLSAELKRIPECPYRISMRAVVENNAETDWTLDKHYKAISDPNRMLLAVILIPLLMAVLVVLSLMWCMKNKEKMFPKVPQPNPELFKDILNNNNKISIPDFCLSKAEEECHVTLVVDPKLIRPQL